jgi:uncharacterized protein
MIESTSVVMPRNLWEVISQRNRYNGVWEIFSGNSHARHFAYSRGTFFARKGGMSLREQFAEQVKASMKAGTAARTSTLRMILARLKDIDIAARPKGIDRVPDEEIVAMLRGMAKSRRESVELYKQGKRQDLVDKEEAEIAIIETFLPQQMDEAAMQQAVADAVAEVGATSIKDMGKVMAALRAKHAATLDMAKAGPMVKAKLA